MRKIKALLIAVFAILVSISPIWAADFNSEDLSYSSFAFTSYHYGNVGFGSSPEAAVANAMRKCLSNTNDCTAGVGVPSGWTHLLVECPEVDLVTAAGFSPDQSQMVISDVVVAWLGEEYIKFDCSVIGGDWEGQPVISWLINTH